jgi:hypothetical protein
MMYRETRLETGKPTQRDWHTSYYQQTAPVCTTTITTTMLLYNGG